MASLQCTKNCAASTLRNCKFTSEFHGNFVAISEFVMYGLRLLFFRIFCRLFDRKFRFIGFSARKVYFNKISLQVNVLFCKAETRVLVNEVTVLSCDKSGFKL